MERGPHLKVEIGAQFLQLIGIKAKVDLSVGSDGCDMCSFKTLEIHQMERITDNYLELCMLQKDVTKFLDSHLGKSVFLVTGAMIAHGATVSSVHKTELSLNAKLGLSGSPEATVGPELEASNSKSRVVYEDSDDFVFAYQIREVFFEKQRIKDRAYNKAARYELGKDEEEVKAWVVYEFDNFELDSGNAPSSETNASIIKTVDEFDGERCECIIPGFSAE
jgi:hypothetical protein